MSVEDELAHPIGFTEIALGLKLYPWQDKTLAPLTFATGPKARRINIACAAPNGSGKDERIIAGAAFWWVTVHKRGKVVITTKSSLQLEQQTIPQLERHKAKFSGYESVHTPRYELTTPSGGKIIAFVTNEGVRAEGWHKEDDIDGPLLMIVNEAKSVEDNIFDHLDRCTVNAQMLVSSTGLDRGRFFKCFGPLKSRWITVIATVDDCPHIPKDQIDHLIATHGIDHPVVQSALYSKFVSQEDIGKYVIDSNALSFLRQNPPNHVPGVKVVFCDFADGGAENVIAYRDGNKIELVSCWREANKFASVSRFISEFRKLKVTPSQVWGDAADKEMCDLLKEAGWEIHRQNFGAPANDSEIYLSWGAEAWRELGIGIEKREWIVPDDDVLTEQLTSRLRAFGRAGKLGIESKADMKKPPRNLPSPDRGDAVAGAAAVRDYAQTSRRRFDRFASLQDALHGSEDRQILGEVGADAGFG